MTLSRREWLAGLGAGAAWLRLGGSRRAAAEGRATVGGTIVASLTSNPLGHDPAAALGYADVTVASLLFDGLYRVDAHAGRVVPQLAAAAPVAEGERALRIRLRRGVRFHDGRAFTADDARASLERAAQAPLTAWALADVEAVRVDGDDLLLALRRAAPGLELALATPGLAVTPGGQPPGKQPIGTGPFAFTSLAAGRLELASFVDHFAGRPYLDSLVLRWFDKPGDEARIYEIGDSHVSLRGAVAFAGHKPKHVTDQVDGAATCLAFLGFGRAHPALLADPSLRAALSLALNRAAFKHVGTGERVVPALSPESPDQGGPSPSAAAAGARLDLARAALAEAAKRHRELAGNDPPRLQLIVDRSRLDDADVAGRVIAAIDSLGLPGGFDALEPAEFARRVAAGKCDLWLGQLCAPSSEPLHELALAFAAGGDDWALKQLVAGSLDRARAADEFARRWPVIPLYHRAVRAHHRRTLHGLAFDVQGRICFADAFQWSP